MKKRMVCGRCGSEDVMRDAWAEWDVELQAWTLRGEPFDQAYCDHCGETEIEERDVEDAAAEVGP